MASSPTANNEQNIATDKTKRESKHYFFKHNHHHRMMMIINKRKGWHWSCCIIQQSFPYPLCQNNHHHHHCHHHRPFLTIAMSKSFLSHFIMNYLSSSSTPRSTYDVHNKQVKQRVQSKCYPKILSALSENVQGCMYAMYTIYCFLVYSAQSKTI